MMFFIDNFYSDFSKKINDKIHVNNSKILNLAAHK